MTSAIRLFSMTMSLGPLAGVPLPSITMALWISRRRTRWPLAGACAMTEQASERAARETIWFRDRGRIVSRYGQGSNRRTGAQPRAQRAPATRRTQRALGRAGHPLATDQIGRAHV